MNMTIRPSYSSYPLLMLGLIGGVLAGMIQGGGGGFIIALLMGGFSGLLLLFGVKGHKYIFDNGLLKIKHWSGPAKSIKLSSVERIEFKPRSFAAGDIILYTAGGKFKIERVRKSQELADTIERQYLASS